MANREEKRVHKNSGQAIRRQDIQNSSHTFHKRQPRKFEQGENVIYVNSKTHTKVHTCLFTLNLKYVNRLSLLCRHILNDAINSLKIKMKMR